MSFIDEILKNPEDRKAWLAYQQVEVLYSDANRKLAREDLAEMKIDEIQDYFLSQGYKLQPNERNSGMYEVIEIESGRLIHLLSKATLIYGRIDAYLLLEDIKRFPNAH